MLEFRLLGPLEIRDGDRVLPSLPPKQRALLAAMLLRAGQFVSRQRLIDDVWGEDVPATVTNSLENQIWRLRQALGKELVLTRPQGYVLDVEPDQVDAVRLERLLARARTAQGEEKAATLRAALALFAGPPLADLGDEPFVRVHAGHLRELEVLAREELVAAELEGERHAELVPELERLVAEHPYRERPRSQLMLALYRSGRQADALAAYQDARRTLSEELGTEPGEELQELHRAILRQDASLRAPTPAAAAPGPAAARPTRKTVTIASFSFANDPALARGLDPESLRAVRDGHASAAGAAVERHGGQVDAARGDAITAAFGSRVASEDDALRATRASFEVVAALPFARVGVDTGEVLVDPGSAVVGEPVEAAERLAQAAGAGEILVGPQTRWLVRDVVSVARAPEVPAYRASALSSDDERRALRLDSPMVGRARELAALQAAFEGTIVARTPHLFTVLGDAGVGKSRLVRELLGRLPEDASVVRGHCPSYGEDVTFTPLVEALGVSAPEEAPKALESRARESPLVAVFEDLHWAEAPFLDLVERVVETARGAPIFVVCTARPELYESRPSWGGGKVNSSSVLVEPLTESESQRLVDNLLGAADLPDAVRDHIAGSSEGNPLFVEELLAMLVDRDVLRREGGRWTTGELPSLAVPPTISALVTARIDRLPEAERVVLELASVAGMEFDAPTVAELANEEQRAAVPEILAALVRKELVRPEGAEERFSFRHELVRDTVYGSIPKARRAELHQRLAETLASDTHAARAKALLGELAPR